MPRSRPLAAAAHERLARKRRPAASVAVLLLTLAVSASAQDAEVPAPDGMPEGPAPAEDSPLEQVAVAPDARDIEIAKRLTGILEATEWFANVQVRVREGVVFLAGTAEREQQRTWAGDLARRTEDVVAVVNRLEVHQRPAWDLAPAGVELERLGRRTLLALPYILVGGLILIVAWWTAKGFTRLVRRLLARRIEAPLLRQVLARLAGLVVFLLGLYIVLRISGLTRLAVTVLGGTGLFGLIVGIAFRDITENFLASILLSTQRPFEAGDLVEVAGIEGYVQRLTTRATTVMTLDGNHVEIPNATVYKSPIRNYSSNPNRRVSFTVGIGYEDAIADAQAVALRVVAEHPAVLDRPEPWVLADGLGPSTVELTIFFWVDGQAHSWLKVKSAVIRLVKRAFQAEGISMPGDVREVVFPRGVSVQKVEPEQTARPGPSAEPSAVSTVAEAGLASDAGELGEQAARSRAPDESQDLLRPPAGWR